MKAFCTFPILSYVDSIFLLNLAVRRPKGSKSQPRISSLSAPSTSYLRSSSKKHQRARSPSDSFAYDYDDDATSDEDEGWGCFNEELVEDSIYH